jgi:hypothetical protein
MTKKFRFSLLGLGVVAAIALLAQLAAPIFAISSDTFGSSRARSEHLAQKKTDKMVAEILRRPLFSAERQPPVIKVVKAEPPKLQGRLAGVMMQPDFREAEFSRAGGKSVSVTEGQVIDGWTVEKIEADQVLLTSAFGEQIVKPTNGTADEMTGPAPRPVGKKAASAQPAGSPQHQQKRSH